MSDGGAPSPLIRTGLRDRLPRGLSYPVGAEVISQALAGCPRYWELWTAFGVGPRPLDPCPPGFEGFRLAFAVICNNLSGTWYLSAPAVPSDERSAARLLLSAAGLPGVREWLCRPRAETWHEGFRTFQVGYTADPAQVCFVESHNHRAVGSSVRAVAAQTPNQALQPTPAQSGGGG